ncbi:hypothetical protein [Sphingobacterium sp.]|uniref:hypothetical protein n=1 Tax=Sphingobacterium sp. TaxID=341027 RepID=UPI0031D4172E
MRTFDFKAMQAHCDLLTQDGKELSVAWDGGNDSGCSTLMLDNVEIASPGPLEEDISLYILSSLGYGSFAGDFSTEGTLTYDRSAQCFAGEDYYSRTDDDILECSIEIEIPEGIWFDELIIHTESYNNCDSLETQIRLRILNGPYPKYFDQIKTGIERQINEKMEQALEHLENLAGIWETYTIPRRHFEVSGGLLFAEIKSIQYSFNSTKVEHISIPIKE